MKLKAITDTVKEKGVITVSYPVINAFLFVALIIFLTILYFKIGRKESEQEIKAILKRKKALSHVFHVGEYISGLDQVSTMNTLESRKILCVIAETSYVFIGFPQDSWKEVGEINRSAVYNVFTENKKRFIQKLSEITRDEEWRLYIEWKDKKGMKRQTVFSFTGSSASSSANEALKILKQNFGTDKYRYGRPAARTYSGA